MQRKSLLLLFIVAVAIATAFWMTKKNPTASTLPLDSKIENLADTNPHVEIPTSPVETQGAAASEKSPSENPSAAVSLTGGNFESFVLKCFQGEECVFAENPLKMYQDFKKTNNRRANDSLISFMRSQLKNKEFRDQYKDSLKQMIDDFYPREEKQFQEAAYYNYLGDLQKSLDLYLDLLEKAKADPSLRDAPNLNIANTLYDMRRFKQALPYYEAALSEYASGLIKADPSPIGFIEDRIADIKTR